MTTPYSELSAPEPEPRANGSDDAASSQTATAAPHSAEPWDAELQWDALLEDIERGSVIPLIGAELFTVRRGAEIRDVDHELAAQLAELLPTELHKQFVAKSLPDDMAAQLSARLRAALEAPRAWTVAEVAAVYMKNGGDRDALYAALRSLVSALEHEAIPKPLEQLAAIKGLRLFVTTTPDGWLARALTEDRGSEPFTVSYSPEGRSNDLPDDYPHRPAIVYHLLGKAGPAPFAATEEDVLEFVHQLQDSGRAPVNLLEALESHQLLLIGCQFPDWLTRFLIRIAKGKRLTAPVTQHHIIAGGPRASDGDEGLETFLDLFAGNTTVLDVGASEFVHTLHERWTAWKTSQPAAEGDEALEAQAKGKVFLSYAHEDAEEARALREALEEEQLAVWLDEEQLMGGDDWNAKIRRNIRQCALFVPVISSTAARETDRYFRYEWSEAAERQKRYFGADRTPFILPVGIDEIDAEADGIPDVFKVPQWVRPDRSLGERAHDPVAASIVRNFRKLQVERTGGAA